MSQVVNSHVNSSVQFGLQLVNGVSWSSVGVLMGASKLAIITSFHGFGDVSVTLHNALSKSSEVLTGCVIDWKLIVQQIVEGMLCTIKYYTTT